MPEGDIFASGQFKTHDGVCTKTFFTATPDFSVKCAIMVMVLVLVSGEVSMRRMLIAMTVFLVAVSAVPLSAIGPAIINGIVECCHSGRGGGHGNGHYNGNPGKNQGKGSGKSSQDSKNGEQQKSPKSRK
jgi:hypothetical protein